MKKEADRRVNDEVLQRLLPPRVVQRLRDADASASELCGSTAFLFLDVPAVREMAVTTEGGSLDELVAYLDTLFNLCVAQQLVSRTAAALPRPPPTPPHAPRPPFQKGTTT